MTNPIKEKILNGEEYFQYLLCDIELAKHTIYIETYIYDDDKLGQMISTALSNAAMRGVKVKLLIDGIGTSSAPVCFKKMKTSGVMIRVFHPLPWKLWQWHKNNINLSFLSKCIYFLSKINTRNHRKTCIIDNDIVYIGSANISQKHLSRSVGGEGWSDTIVRIQSVNIENLVFAFDRAWENLLSRKKIPYLFQSDPDPIFRLNFSRRYRRKLYKILLKKISEATHRIWVTSAYFNPDYFLLKHLISAAKRGVDVSIILPNKSDVAIMPLVARNFYHELLSAKVNIFEYLPGILHTKILIIDDWYCIGSSNLNHRSLRHDLEVDVHIQTTATKKILHAQFLENMRQSKKFNFDDLRKQSLYSKILGRLLLYIKYFL